LQQAETHTAVLPKTDSVAVAVVSLSWQ